ncbi:MAG: cation-translocating P-type ATPase [Promethearchaeota archaeon]
MEDLKVHAKPVEEVIKLLNTSIENGLTDEEVKERQLKYGKNVLIKEKGKTAWQIFINQFRDFLIYLLFIAIIISIIIGWYESSKSGEPWSSEYTDAIVITAILIVNAVLGFYQEYQAEKSMESLKKLAEDLVPGDVILFEEGDKFPADVRIFKQFSLYVDEAILTGESKPVKKQTDPVEEELILADRTNIGFMNTIVTRGNGEGVVFAIGMNTEIGKIAESLQEEQMEISPFQQEVNRFGKLLGIIIVIICILVFVVELFLVLISYNWTIPASSLDELIVAFEIAISLAVSAVPEGLVVVITVVMSIGMRKMADRNALVRNLTAVETLGRVNIICSDKTGTLTKNEMTVVRIFINNKVYKVDGVGYNIIGKILDEDNNVVKMDDYLQKFLEVCMFCNNSNVSVKDEETGETIVVGDPTEISMKILAMKMNLQTKAEKVHEIPFNSDRKMMSVVMRMDGQLYALIKGAPDILMNNASKGIMNGQEVPIEKVKKKILDQNKLFAKEALRVLGVAYKPIPDDFKEEEIEKDFIYLGLVGIIDPARDEVKNAIEEAKMAGIRTIMITGDHKDTAVAIAHQIGLTESGEAITGVELNKMSDDELREKVKTVDIYARVTSEHKLRILKRLKELGKIVAMTGDGVNDALKKHLI